MKFIGPFSGYELATSLVHGQLQTDADGYIITVPGTTQTSVRGVFAVGDVQDKRYRQMRVKWMNGRIRS
jgi:thioredoxin reductase (NADPH)